MGEEKTTVSGLVTDAILKQAMSTTAVRNAMKAQVTMLLCEDIDAAVDSALSSLTGLVADSPEDTDDAAEDKKEHIVKEINTGASADTAVADTVEPQPGDTAQAEAGKASVATETQGSGEAAVTENAAGATATTTAAQPAETKTTAAAQSAEVKTAAADQTQKQA
ncbi:TPA: DUF826 domain-containing protein [Escherichia coli]|uniref:DUF826 domain-containing protein n=1 Tax=Escherichia coli TaxID=562 RepID=UPI0012FE628F|nr:DUF826 domain-containing protein [Escherichia coli]MVW26356.1 hypothetical protein [Escherichia coli]HBV6503563.1 DUF826 domain-containing protein [Escherichia coli]